MFHRTIVVMGTVFVIAAMALVPVKLMGSDSPTEFKSGDTVFVNVERTEFKLGDVVLKTLSSGAKLTVTGRRGDWIGGTVDINGTKAEGWVLSSHLSRIKPGAASGQTGPKTESATKADIKKSAGEHTENANKEAVKAKSGEEKKMSKSLASQFAQMMEERESGAEEGKGSTLQLPNVSPDQAGCEPAKKASSQVATKTDVTPPEKQLAAHAKAPATELVNAMASQETPNQPAQGVVEKSDKPAADQPNKKPDAKTAEKTAADKGKPPVVEVARPKVADQPAKKGTGTATSDPNKRVIDPASGKDIGEGPEALAEKFAKMLAKQRGTKPAQESPEKPAEKKAVPQPTPEPEIAIDPSRLPENQQVTISVLILRIADDLVDVEPSERIGQLVLSGDQFTNRSLRELKGLSVASLSIEAVNVSNVSLQYVKEVRGVLKLRLWSPGFVNGALPLVANLRSLTVLDIEGTAIDGTGLESLRGMKKLETLILGKNVSDSKIAGLSHLPALIHLDLRACGNLSLACLEPLANLKNLQVIWLPRHLRTKGKRALRVTLPECRVRS